MNLQTTYIRILRDTLEKKQRVLEEIYEITKQQERALKKTTTQTEELDLCMDHKSECLKVVNELDDGFEMLYAKVREELRASSGELKEEIENLKKLVNRIMELSISIQALEQRNKVSMERYFLRHRKNIRDYQVSSKRVNNYYNTMTGMNAYQSYFMDKKK